MPGILYQTEMTTLGLRNAKGQHVPVKTIPQQILRNDKIRSFAWAGQVVMTAPNKEYPELIDAAVVWSDIRLSALDPTLALALIDRAITEAALTPRQGLPL